MGCLDDYTIQAIMRTGYAHPPNERRHALWCDIEDLDAEIKRKELDRDLLDEEIEAMREERREKYDKFMDM